MRDSEAFVALEQFIRGQDAVTNALLSDTSTDSPERPALLKRVQVDPLQVLDHVRPGRDQSEAIGVNANGGDQKPFDGTVS